MLKKLFSPIVKNKYIIDLILVLFFCAVGYYLRIYNIRTTYYFSGELGKEMLYIRQFALSHSLPFVGMATSHEWLSYGPFYYWLMIPIFNLFNGSPFILFWVAILIAIFGLFINYIVVKKVANRKIAAFSTLIQAFSPLFIWQTRLSKLHVFFFVFMPILMYLAHLLWNKQKKWLFLTGLTFGLLFSFHFSQIPLLVVFFLIFWIKRQVFKFKDVLFFLLGIIVPNVTLIFKDIGLALWVPYRIVSLNDKKPMGTFNSLIEFFGRSMFWNPHVWILGLISFLIIFVSYIYNNKKNSVSHFLPFYLTSSIGVVLIANIIHGSPPVHYFLPIFTLVPILYSEILVKYKWTVFLLILVFITNLNGYFKFDIPTDYVPLDKQQSVANFIIKYADLTPFSIKRIGPFDYFPENYSQNYKYLILYKGGNLVDSSDNIYTIIEENNDAYVQK